MPNQTTQPNSRWFATLLFLALAFAGVVGCAEQADKTPLVVVKADAGPDQAEPIDFNRDIRPILSDRCFACHGPDAKVANDAGGFRLDTVETATAPATSGDIPIVPGKPDESELINRITHTNKNLQMPPPKSNLTLSDKEIELLRRWIEQGAHYEGHWAYETPIKPEPPTIVNEDWALNAIDYFIAAQIEKAGLSPSKQADRETLIRRLSLDLTGLPPTPEQIDAFVKDPAPDSYEKIIDRLLASPHFGERMAIVWLDAARYGDTNGFHHDNIRTAWPWRQWVIQAFNENKPYDQFIIEQLAGDLLPNATQQQILASGFCRMHNINDEGGALNDEYLVEAIADRVETVATVFMAQTFTCARCHDHKYDPTTQDDYYSTWAYFNSVEGDRGVYANNRTEARAYPPRMMWKSDELKAQIEALTPQVTATRAEHEKAKPLMMKDLAGWETALRSKAGVAWAQSKLTAAESSNKETKVQIKDRAAQLSGQVPDQEDITLTLTTQATGLRLIKLDVLPARQGRKTVLGRNNGGNAVLTTITAQAVSIKDPDQKQDVTLNHAWADKTQADGDYNIANALKEDASGWAVAGHQDPTSRTALFVADKPFGFPGGTELHVTLKHRSEHKQHTLAHVRLDVASAGDDVLSAFADDESGFDLQPLGLVDRELLPEQGYTRYFEAWRAAKSPANDKLAQRRAQLDKQLQDLENQAVPVLIMKEAPQPVPAYILERGQYDKPVKERIDQSGPEPVTVKVQPQERKVPAFLGVEMPNGAPNNRLGYAMWLTRPDHPLTARVHVNRLWQMLFGTGIVSSVEDFGNQAAWPSHPDLLDHLAVSFVDSGWDQKALIKQIVSSATYRQRAVTQSAALEVDPDNRLLSSFPRRRLAGELIRDQALFVSGLLNDQIGGPSVKPYQPGDLWNEVAIGGTNTGRFQRDTGEALYRRSMYTFWKKTSPPAQMAIFNAPTREFCIVRRDVTNTPLQALVLWNDEQFLEAARALAQRTLVETDSDDARLSLIYQRCTGQAPDERIMIILRETLSHFKQRYNQSPEDAKALLQQGEHPLPETYDPGELASWMMIASSVLSLDETIVRD